MSPRMAPSVTRSNPSAISFHLLASLFLKIDRGQQRDLRPVGLLSCRPQHPTLELQVAEFGLRQVSLTEIIAKEVNLESRRLGRSSCERCGEVGKRLRLTSSLIEPSGM